MSNPQPSPDGFSSAVRRVLVCESDPEVRGQLCATLSQAGWVVEAHFHASTLIEEVTRPGGRVDAVVVALDAPGTDGLSFVDYLHSVRPNLPIVLLAIRGEAPSYQEARRAGASFTLDHPLDFDALSAFLAHAVGKQRLLSKKPTAKDERPNVVTVPWAPTLPVRVDDKGTERRREERYELDRPRAAKLRVEGEEEARDASIRNVTSRGCGLVHQGGPLALDQRVSLVCRLPRPVDRTFRIAGRVAWSRPSPPGNEIGLEFEKPDSPAARQVVFDLLVAD